MTNQVCRQERRIKPTFAPNWVHGCPQIGSGDVKKPKSDAQSPLEKQEVTKKPKRSIVATHFLGKMLPQDPPRGPKIDPKLREMVPEAVFFLNRVVDLVFK